MSLNIRDAESAYLEAVAEVEEFRNEVIKEFLQPDLDLTLITLFERIPPEVRAQLQQMNPAEYAKFEQQVTAAKERYKHGPI